jgi:hypothetical protein
MAQTLGVICLHEAAKTLPPQQTQAQVQANTHKPTRREQLYTAFITEASKLYADPLVFMPDLCACESGNSRFLKCRSTEA